MIKKIMLIFGTRPEAVKMCPLVLELKKYSQFEVIVCLTGQHNEMLHQVVDSFGITADYDLKIMKSRQTITSITTRILSGLENLFSKITPDLVLVHGDTTSSFAAALASYYKKIPIAHVEAGLRTYNIYSPFPEEANRQLTDQISTLLFAPTFTNKDNLLKQGIVKNVFVTGNTVIDSFKYTVKNKYLFSEDKLNNINFSLNKTVLVTAHRRENLGLPLINICEAIKNLSSTHKDCLFLFPVHPNPNVKKIVYEFLNGLNNVILLAPLSIFDMHNLLPKLFLVMTDSGGLQEEAPHFGKPVLVLREETERQEAVSAGTVKICGTSTENIISYANSLLTDLSVYNKMAMAKNPYGKGNSSELIANIILNYFFCETSKVF